MGPVAAVLTVASTVANYAAQQKQAKAAEAQAAAARKQTEMQQRIADVQAQRSRMAAIRKQQMQAAQIESSAANTGVGYSSGAYGGVASAESQLYSALGSSYEQQSYAHEATIFNLQQSQAAQSAMNSAYSLGGAATIFSAGAGIANKFQGSKYFKSLQW